MQTYRLCYIVISFYTYFTFYPSVHYLEPSLMVSLYSQCFTDCLPLFFMFY